jgi:signal-transduction protein with cAMP-binding, CBS, and nucleotidyltransferase domain
VENMRISEVMLTPAVTCSPTTTVAEAARIMGRRNVGSVVVVDRVGEVAGIVADRDIALRGVAPGRSADIAVEEIMSRDVATVDPRADVTTALSTMMKRRVRRLPVVDERGLTHGLIAFDDLVRNLGQQAEELNEFVLLQASAFPPAP